MAYAVTIQRDDEGDPVIVCRHRKKETAIACERRIGIALHIHEPLERVMTATAVYRVGETQTSIYLRTPRVSYHSTAPLKDDLEAKK